MGLKERREAAGLTQQELAAAIEVDQSAVSNWERGKNGICNKYKRRLDEILGDEENTKE